MHVLFVTSGIRRVGGIQRYNAGVIEVLKKRVEVEVVNREGYASPLRFGCAFFRAIVHTRPDFIFIGHINFASLALCAKALGIPYVVFTHGVEVWNIKSPMQRVALRSAPWVITVSSYTRGKLLAQIPGLAERIFWLPGPVRGERFCIKPPTRAFIEKYGLRGKKVILTVGRMDATERRKGYDKVIEAMPSVLRRVPEACYVIVGEGNDRARIEQFIHRFSLEDKVMMPGGVGEDELVDFYNLADVYAMPSMQEGLGIVFLEALACGTPVVAGNKDGSSDAVLGGKLGLLVDPEDTGEVGKAIASILEGKIRSLTDGQLLREEVLRVFGYDKFEGRVNALLDILRRKSDS